MARVTAGQCRGARAPVVCGVRANAPLPDRGRGLPDLAPVTRPDGTFTIAGFGSLLSTTSSRLTFPDLVNFRRGTLPGWRRVFAHTTAVFHERGVARPATREVASLSVEPCAGTTLQVALFDVPATDAVAAALLDREHEFKFVAVEVGEPGGGTAVALACARWTDAEYRAQRIADAADWARRYHGRYPDGAPYRIDAVWDDDDVLPCRPYLRHVVLAARALGADVEACVLDNTFLVDGTTVRQHLARDPGIMQEAPPPGLEARYGG